MNNQRYRFWAALLFLSAAVGNVFGQANFTFAPSYGAAGDAVVITGSGFTANTTVWFGSKQDTTARATSDRQINAKVPSGLTLFSPVLIKVNGIYSQSYFTPIGTGPYISNFSPTNGDSTTTVTLFGANFTSSPKVYFNGTAASYVSSTVYGQITVRPPANVITGPIKVVTTGGTFVSSNLFYGHPSITGFTPTTGRAGTSVKISGNNFTGASSVTFNDLPANFTVDSNTNITAIVPVGVTRGKIMVVTPDMPIMSTNDFTVPPTVTDFSPKTGKTNTVVTITGLNLSGGNVSVSFNGGLGYLTSITPSQIQAIVLATASSGPITVSTGDGSFTTSNLFYLPPEVTFFNPGSGPVGTVIEITGNNLVDITNVTFSGVSALFTNANRKITATVPAGAQTGNIGVAGPGGAFTFPVTFAVPPTVLSFSPDAGIVGSQVQITGNGFGTPTNVIFNGVTAQFSGTNDVVTATVPPGATTGKIVLQNKGGTASSSANFRVDTVKLSVARLTNNGALISWPTSAVGYVLQSLTNLAQTNWISNTNTPVVSNISNSVTNSEGAPAQLYRLKK